MQFEMNLQSIGMYLTEQKCNAVMWLTYKYYM